MTYVDIDWVAFFAIIGVAAAMTVLLTYFLVPIAQRAVASTPRRHTAKPAQNAPPSGPASKVSDEVSEPSAPVLLGR